MINHLLFMDDLKKPYGKNENQVDPLVPSVRIVDEDMPMKFGIPKCSEKCSKVKKSCYRGIKRCDHWMLMRMKTTSILGCLEADDVKHSKMKDSIEKEYFRTVKRILNSIREIR